MKMAGHCAKRARGVNLCLLLCALALPGFAGRALLAAEAAKDKAFKLSETSALEQGDFLRGQSANCEEKPFAAVKHYPAFVSQKPIYGSIRFAEEEGKTNSGMLFYFAIDESQGTGKGYDRLYFDLNRDLDLRNDPALKPQSLPPEKAKMTWSDIKQQVLFDCLSIDFDLGPAGKRPIQLMPRLIVALYGTRESKQVAFVRTHLYEGEISIGGRPYQARLGEEYAILGRLDQPGTELILDPQSEGGRAWWLGGDSLMAAHKVGGSFYTFSANPVGDEFTVHPYRGDLGTFEIGPGGRPITNLTASGSLSGTNIAVAVGGQSGKSFNLEPVPRCQLPVGDYLPSFLTLNFGRLRLQISDNYHSDGKSCDRAGRPHVYGFTIRKDKPYVLDFSNKPEVMFASPARDQKFKPGDTVQVKGVLVDPKLDFMIRGLEDTTRPKASPQSRGRNFSLDPKVVITRANGEKVAEGVMPFG
jgi:hypothetical protein